MHSEFRLIEEKSSDIKGGIIDIATTIGVVKMDRVY